MEKTRIIYFGTSDFAVPPLRALLDRPDFFEIAAVVSRPDRPAGRKGEMRPSAVSSFARERSLKLLQPESLKDGKTTEDLKSYDADIFVVAAYGQIMPKDALDIPRRGALNLHGSLLPRYRGASPIQTTILEGDDATGVTLMLMDEKMDHGPTLSEAVVGIDPGDDYPSLSAKLAAAAARLIVEDLPKFTAGRLEPKEQEHGHATYTRILKKEDGEIRWENEDAEEIERKIRAFTPWPGTFAEFGRGGGSLRMKIIRGETFAHEPHGMEPGTVIRTDDGYPAVSAKHDALKLIEVQPIGRRPMAGDVFLRGYPDILA